MDKINRKRIDSGPVDHAWLHAGPTTPPPIPAALVVIGMLAATIHLVRVHGLLQTKATNKPLNSFTLSTKIEKQI